VPIQHKPAKTIRKISKFLFMFCVSLLLFFYVEGKSPHIEKTDKFN
jgi:hypothetical protein